MIALLFPAAYLIGAIPTGYWLGKAWKGVDVRKHGSGNLGATNVFRVLGKGPGVITLTVDILKGLLPVLVMQRLFPGNLEWSLTTGLLTILGHTTSPFVGFRGGKGVATSAGVFAALLPWPAAAAVATFGVALLLSGYVSLSSILAAIVLTFSAWVLKAPYLLQLAAAVVGVFVIWKHRGNIQRLRAGTENRIR